MTPLEFVLMKVAEESGELAEAASQLSARAGRITRLCAKTICFGPNSYHPDNDRTNNRIELLRELKGLDTSLLRVTSELEDTIATSQVLRRLEEFGLTVEQRAHLDEFLVEAPVDLLVRMQAKLRKWSNYVPVYLERLGALHPTSHKAQVDDCAKLVAEITATVDDIENILKARGHGFSF